MEEVNSKITETGWCEKKLGVGGGTHFYRIGYHIFKEKREQTGEVLAFSDEMHVLTLVMLSKKTSVKLGATIKTY